jgi:hypothetical protein
MTNDGCSQAALMTNESMTNDGCSQPASMTNEITN